MNLLNVQVHNVKGVRDIDLNLEGHNLVLVGGENAQGKSSLLDSIMMCLCGRRGFDFPDVSIRDGEKTGYVKTTISPDPDVPDQKSLTAELSFRKTRSGTVTEEFRLVDEDGDESPNPRKILNDLYDLRAFDPLVFENSKTKDQIDLIKKLAGIDFTELDTEYQEKYDERRGIGKEGEKLSAKVDNMVRHGDVPEEMISVDDLMDELKSRQDNKKAVVTANSVLDAKMKEHEACQSHSLECANQIKELEEKLKAAKESHKSSVKLEKQILDEAEVLKKNVDKLGALNTDTASVESQIKEAGATNEKIAGNKARAEVVAERDEARKQYKKLTQRLESIKKEKVAMLEGAKLPVDGLEFDEEKLYLNNTPWNDCSGRERLEVSTKIGMAMNPKLKLLICKDGGRLDVSGLEAIEKLAKEKDYQFLIELVTRTEEDEKRCAVVISDGMVKS